WDHLDTLVKQEFNAREYMKGIKAKISPPCELPVKVIDGRPTAIAPSHAEFERVASQPLLCYNCGLECDLALSRQHLEEAYSLHERIRTYQERVATITDGTNPADLSTSPAAAPALIQLMRAPTVTASVTSTETGAGAAGVRSTSVLFRYRASFKKGEEVKYLSHLDLTRALPRAFRRAGIRLGYSQGFHPMPLLQYGPALAVGIVGENEFLDFDSLDELSEAEFISKINAALPEGLRFRTLKRLQPGSRTLIKVVNRAEYEMSLDAPEILAS